MPEGDFSTPSYVIYINNTRVPGEREAEVKEITITEKLNAPSTFAIRTSDPDGEWRENEDYFIGSRVKILMGYKDDLKELIIGDITGLSCSYKKNRADEVTIIGNNLLHNLQRTVKNQQFTEMTPKDIISEIADGAGLKAEVEDLTYEHPFTLLHQMSDLDYLQVLSERYDCFFSVTDSTLSFKRLQKNASEDVVLEYGKTLLSFLPEADTTKLISEIEVYAWNPAKHEAITGAATAQDIDSPGGAVINDKFDGVKAVYIDQYALDQNGADQRAVDILTVITRDYVKGNGSTYGNPEIHAGTIVKVEGIGGKFSGKYFILSAIHKLIPLKGYKTSFTFTSALGSPVQASSDSSASSSQAAASESGAGETGTGEGESGEEGTEEQDETTPSISNPQWMKDGEQISSALVQDKVLLTADTSNIDDGARVRITIWEKDDVGSDDFIKQFFTTVKSNKVEGEWEVIYTEDRDDTESSSEEAEKGYTLPEYIFVMDTTSGPEADSGESPVLEVRDWMEFVYMNEDQEPIAGETFEVLKNDDSKVDEVTSDDEGVVHIEGLEIGTYKIKLKQQEEGGSGSGGA